MPPAQVRRPLTITTWILVSLTVLILSPMLLALGALLSRLLRKPQPQLLVRIMVAYCARELGVLVACGALWLTSGFGILMRSRRMQRLHYRLLEWFVHGLAGRILDLLRVEVVPSPSAEAEAALRNERPLLFFSRHAGPGDTMLLVDLLLARYHRLPSVVFKEGLAIDPCVDLIGHRLPHAVLDTEERDECKRQIEAVSAHLPSHGALLLFPEGANFTPQRRRRALTKLRRKGRRREAASGERMEHVLPPHPTGALAALGSRPDADVIFGAHTGLGLAAFPKELWRNPPIGRTLSVGMWLSPASERPTDPDGQVQWLYAWWKRLDEWIEQQRQEGPAVRAAVD